MTPAVIGLSPFAREAWITIHDTIECESGEFGELVNVQAATSKAAANVLRMAGVMAAVEESTVLEGMHIQRASTLMDYYLAESQRLTEQEPLNKLRAEAACLLRWLIKKNWPPFRLRDLTRNGPRFARKSTRCRRPVRHGQSAQRSLASLCALVPISGWPRLQRCAPD